MIYDELSNLEKYYHLFSNYSDIQSFLLNFDFSKVTPQRFKITESVYANISEYLTQSEVNLNWEIHKQYLDIQIAIDGKEYIGYSINKNMDCIEPYAEDKDIAFYRGTAQLYLPLKNDFFAIFFPGEFHKPGIMIDEPVKVKKIVIKVLWNR